MLAGAIAGMPVILAFGPSAFAGYLAGLLLFVTSGDWLLDRWWPIPADDGLEEFLTASHAETPEESPES